MDLFKIETKKIINNFPLTLADVRVVQLFIVGTIKSRFALVAVDALSVVTAFLTHSTTFIESVDIKRFAKMVNLRVVLTLVRMSKTIASWKRESESTNCWPNVIQLGNYVRRRKAQSFWIASRLSVRNRDSIFHTELRKCCAYSGRATCKGPQGQWYRRIQRDRCIHIDHRYWCLESSRKTDVYKIKIKARIQNYKFFKIITRRVRVKSFLEKDVHWPSRVFGLKSLKRILVAFVHSWRTVELKKLVEDGRLFNKETTIYKSIILNYFKLKNDSVFKKKIINFTSPSSRGTTLLNWVSQMTESSFVMGSIDSTPKLSTQSETVSAKYCQGI